MSISTHCFGMKSFPSMLNRIEELLSATNPLVFSDFYKTDSIIKDVENRTLFLELLKMLTNARFILPSEDIVHLDSPNYYVDVLVSQ
jgi:hypothetical protein